MLFVTCCFGSFSSLILHCRRSVSALIFLVSGCGVDDFESAMPEISCWFKFCTKGQMEAGLSTGLSYVEVLRASSCRHLKAMLPAIVSQLISLIKDTSLAVIISLPELTHHARIIYGQNTNYVLPMFLAMTVLYFWVCYALSLLSGFLKNVSTITKRIIVKNPRSVLSMQVQLVGCQSWGFFLFDRFVLLGKLFSKRKEYLKNSQKSPNE